MMTGFACLLFIAGVIQGIASQGPPPPQCRGPPPGIKEHPHDCCKFPLQFTDEELKSCGFEKHTPLEESKPGPPPSLPDCSKQICILKKYDLLNDDETINFDKCGKFLDEYGASNPDFQPSVEKVKERCFTKDLPGPPHICDANKFIFCYAYTMLNTCPKWEETDGCKALKNHMEECRKYIPSP